jgi:hypothetical protein
MNRSGLDSTIPISYQNPVTDDFIVTGFFCLLIGFEKIDENRIHEIGPLVL